jgi:predicted DNA-binding transcriptional regulator AlpA
MSARAGGLGARNMRRFTTMTSDLLTATETAKRIGVHRATIWRWTIRGLFIVPVRRGPRPMWRAQDVDQWLKARGAGE